MTLLESLSVACIGLGRMGSGIARNIQKTDCRLTVYNRTVEKAQSLVSAGAMLARTPREAAAAADFVVTNLMDDASVLAAVSGADGILDGMRPGAVHIGTTTISPRLSARLAGMHAEHGSRYVAAPVAGRPDAASAGRLLTFLGGRAEDIERSRPVIEAYAPQVFVMGEDPAVAMSMKLAGNFFIAALVELIGQTYVFAEKRGVDSAIVTQLFKGFIPGAHEYLERISSRRFDRAGFTLDAGLKDVSLVLEAAGEVNVPLPCASMVRDSLLAARALGMSQLDWSCLTEIARLNAGQVLPPSVGNQG
jgi:3-hydroxyisobutyrate dehydrogenase-like beta-hydroxyacid dehydrogenase